MAQDTCVLSFRSRARAWIFPAFLAAVLSPALLPAQTIDDATMLPGRTLFAGYLYTHDSWDQYWEGTLKRKNGNLGTVSTQTSTIYLDYGITDRVNVIAKIPYVWTNASQGVLASQEGWQDLTLAAKVRIGGVHIPHAGSLNWYGAGVWTNPMRNYTPDFLPLSIGLASMTRGLRSTVNLRSETGLFVTGTGQYTWREDITLDRDYYYTNNQFFLTSNVPMPRVVDYAISAGFSKNRRMARFDFNRLITQGGIDSGDIRRQDAPFPANRFIASRIGATMMYPVPFVRNVDLRFEYSHVIDGRNVGQSNTFTVGIFKTLHF
jgi:hypothetical protein